MSAKACVIAFAMFAHLAPFGIRLCSTSMFNYYTALLQQALPAITEAATVDGFQACILLVWHHLSFISNVSSVYDNKLIHIIGI